ncbi:MucR family transcriptional regulator [Phyllobacterium sp. LjRoot231]|uniref:MucR family transcriptional regulator n=1 Tax=Phyllobacterium sp. LjRoot231 TaxID=3342289 RepID=UPI003F4F4779
MSAPEAQRDLFVELTAGSVAAYVRNNALRAADLTALIHTVHASLADLDTTRDEPTVAPAKPERAVNPKRSVTPDYIVCLKDGRTFKSLDARTVSPRVGSRSDLLLPPTTGHFARRLQSKPGSAQA